MKRLLLVSFLLVVIFSRSFARQAHARDSIMITVFLKHQEEKNLDTIQAIQYRQQFFKLFPPKGARVVSWYVMMGVGQVVTVKIPAADLRTLNTAIEKSAWGAFNTEFYPTYDYMPVWKSETAKKP